MRAVTAATLDRVQNAFEGMSPDLVESNLSAERETELREAFAEEE